MDSLVFATLGLYLDKYDRQSAFLANKSFNSTEIFYEDHIWIIDITFILTVALMYLNKRRPNLKRLKVIFSQYQIINETEFTNIFSTLSTMAQKGITIDISIFDTRCYYHLINNPIYQCDNLHIKMHRITRRFLNDTDALFKFFEMYKVSLFKNAYYHQGVFFQEFAGKCERLQGKIDTWHIIFDTANANTVEMQMPLEISKFCRHILNLIVKTSYNLGIHDTDTDIAFHANATHLYDDYDESDEIKYKQHLAAYKKCTRLQKITFSHYNAAMLTDLIPNLPGSVKSIAFKNDSVNSCLRDPEITTLVLMLSMLKQNIKFKIIVRKTKYICNKDEAENRIYGCILWYQIKNMGIDVELIGLPEWKIAPLDVLYARLLRLGQMRPFDPEKRNDVAKQ